MARKMKASEVTRQMLKVVAKFGAMAGCQGCDAIGRRGRLFGRLGYNHSSECRARVKEAMSEDPECKRLVEKQAKNETTKHLELVTEEQRHEHPKRA